MSFTRTATARPLSTADLAACPAAARPAEQAFKKAHATSTRLMARRNAAPTDAAHAAALAAMQVTAGAWQAVAALYQMQQAGPFAYLTLTA